MSFHYLLSIIYHTRNIDERIGSSTQIIHGNGPLDALTNWITRDRTSEEPAFCVFTLDDNITVSIKIEPIELPDHVFPGAGKKEGRK